MKVIRAVSDVSHTRKSSLCMLTLHCVENDKLSDCRRPQKLHSQFVILLHLFVIYSHSRSLARWYPVTRSITRVHNSHPHRP